MNTAAKMVAAYFESQDTGTKEVRENVLMNSWRFEGGNMDIFYEFKEDSSRVHIQGINFISVPSDKYDCLYKTINECNAKYYHEKFILDTEHGQIVVEDDDLIQLDTCGEECFELMIRMVQTVEKAYPLFMKAMYA